MLKIYRFPLLLGCLFAGYIESFALPMIVFQPSDAVVAPGESATFSVRYPRGTTPDVQWRLNGEDIPGEKSQDLVITNAQLSDAGAYTVVLKDSEGSVTSTEARLNIIAPIAPPFDPELSLDLNEGMLAPTWTGDGALETASTPDGPWEIVESTPVALEEPTYYRVQNPVFRPTSVYIPASYKAEEPMPLVMLLHGYASTPEGTIAYFGMEAMANSRGFLFCAPSGMRENNRGRNTFWNALKVFSNFLDPQVDDVAYLTSLIMEIQKQWNVDPKRIHILGYSNGAQMSYRMALEEASLIASIAGLAGTTETPDVYRPTEPVHILHIHGTADEALEYEGGTFIDPSGILPQFVYPGAFECIEIWADYNRNTGQTTEDVLTLDLDLNVPSLDTRVTRYSVNPPGGVIELWSIEGARHGPNLTFSQFPEKVIDWLLAHPKP